MSKNAYKTPSRELDLYTLDEASAITRCNIPSILQMAADGHISLHTTIPIGWEIYSIETLALPDCEYKKSTSLLFSLRANFFGSFEKADPAIELLILRPNDCKNLKTFNHVKQGAFRAGLKTTYNHQPSQAIPTKKKNIHKIGHGNTWEFPFQTRCFAIYKTPTYKEESINWNVHLFPYQETIVTQDTIRIAHGELKIILEATTLRESEKPTESKALNNENVSVIPKRSDLKNISQRPYTPGRAHTKLLETLYKVSKHSWEKYRATGKYPCNLAVEANIKEICPECSKSLAKKSATMIKPPSCERNESSPLFLTNYFWALVDTNEKFYGQSLPEEKCDKEDILEWLENNFEFESSLALAGSRIIDPYFEANIKSILNPPEEV